MRKIIGFILLASLGVLSSCNLDKYPHDQIPQVIETYADAANIRIGLYSDLKSITTGLYGNAGDFQSDLFDATSFFGNRNGQFFTWQIQMSDADITGMWYGWYSVIAQANFLIDGISALNTEDFTDEEKENLNAFIGEAYWFRAFCYYNMAINWCAPYDAETAESTDGLPLQKTYAPTGDRSRYPGRSNLFDTFEFIQEDLTDAATLLALEPGSVNSYFVNIDVVTALQARVALWMKDWTNAATLAQGLINSNKYNLIQNQDDFTALWTDDEASNEVLLMSQMTSYQDIGGATGLYFLYDVNNNGVLNPSFIPTQTLLNMYPADDIRLGSYFRQEHITVVGLGEGDLYVVTKYPGNPALKAPTGNNYINKGKVFRIAEMYLIAAEALAMQGEDGTASGLLNDLRGARSATWTRTEYAGNALMNEIRSERMKELFAEGFRMTDLKRWGMAMNRSALAPQPVPVLVFDGVLHGDLIVEPGDYRFCWPIPRQELDVNPQIADQQNPGY